MLGQRVDGDLGQKSRRGRTVLIASGAVAAVISVAALSIAWPHFQTSESSAAEISSREHPQPASQKQPSSSAETSTPMLKDGRSDLPTMQEFFGSFASRTTVEREKKTASGTVMLVKVEPLGQILLVDVRGDRVWGVRAIYGLAGQEPDRPLGDDPLFWTPRQQFEQMLGWLLERSGHAKDQADRVANEFTAKQFGASPVRSATFPPGRYQIDIAYNDASNLMIRMTADGDFDALPRFVPK